MAFLISVPAKLSLSLYPPPKLSLLLELELFEYFDDNWFPARADRDIYSTKMYIWGLTWLFVTVLLTRQPYSPFFNLVQIFVFLIILMGCFVLLMLSSLSLFLNSTYSMASFCSYSILSTSHRTFTRLSPSNIVFFWWFSAALLRTVLIFILFPMVSPWLTL